MTTAFERFSFVLQKRLARRVMGMPRPMLDALFSGRRPSYRGALLDPHLQLALRMGKLSKRPELYTLTPEAARAQAAAMTLAIDLPKIKVAKVEADTLGGVPVRIYKPVQSTGPLPALVFYHGGGFVIGTLDAYDPGCRFLAKHAGCVVISVDYKLAPEHPFPAGPTDAWNAYEAVTKGAERLGIDPARIAVGGDSAGGCLSAVVAQRARDEGAARPCFQLLIYPGVDALRDTTSFHDLVDRDYVLSRPLMAWFGKQYVPEGVDRDDVRLSPLRARDFRGLARARVVTAGFDPLRDEGEAYANKLKEAGVEVEYRCHESAIHGFWNMAGTVPEARQLLEESVASLRVAFAEL